MSLTLAFCEKASLSSACRFFQASPSKTLMALNKRKKCNKELFFLIDRFHYLLSLPGCCCISSKRYFLANNMNPFIGLLGLLSSLADFLAGDIGGDIMLAEPDEDLTGVGSKFAMP